MRKKRKKNTSTFHSLVCQSHLFSKADIALMQNPGSAPDVPTRSILDPELSSCYNFAVELFGKEELPIETHISTVCLRTFSKQLGDNTSAKWNTVEVGDRLYVRATPEMSKNTFVTLMDYAEEVLEVAQVIVCLDRNSACFGELVKCFRFMGFEHIVPNHSVIPRQARAKGNYDSSFPNSFHFLGYDVDQ